MGLEESGSAADDHSTPHRPSGLPPLDRTVAAANFPVYGLIGHSGGLALQGIGYGSTYDEPEWPANVSEVVFGYAYPPAARRSAYYLKLNTTNPHRRHQVALRSDGSFPLPDGDRYDDDGSPANHYGVLDDVPPDATEAHAIVIERFPLLEQTVALELRWRDHPPLQWGPRPQWSFTLTAPGIQLSGAAAKWRQAELLALLQQVGTISNRPEVLAQYRLELAAWGRYFRAARDAG